jgi:D-alanyl-D-alanine carboxypeptidase
MNAASASELCEAWARGRGSVGLAVAVGSGEPTRGFASGGLAVGASRDAADEPAFLAYSITKTLLATLLLVLQEQGRLELDDVVAPWFPAVPSADRISLRQLLRHTAGIPDYGGLRAYHEAVRATPKRPWSFERFAAETWERGLACEPGSRFGYSNPGYLLLRRIAEQVGGDDLPALLERHVTGPLGLARTRVAERLEDLAALEPATSTRLSETGAARDVRHFYHPGWVSHGVVASTPSELARFLRAVFDGTLLGADSLAQMTETVPVPNAPPEWREPGYGLGLMGDRGSRWGPVWGHGGGGPGTVSAVFHAPTLADGRGVTACAMCAVEEDPLAERMVFAAFDRLR